jgi:hypothetical protein
MKHIREELPIPTDRLRSNSRGSAETVEDHHREDEAPEDRCRKEESPGSR